MSVSRVRVAFAVLGLLVLWGCSTGPRYVAKVEPWREDEESACLNSGRVRESAFLRGRSSLGAGGACGASRPFEMSAASRGRISMRPAALLRCPMIPQVESWVETVIEPAARLHLRGSIAELKVAASYACRPINHQWGARLSEHGLANALDISEFILTDGRRVTVKQGWWGDSGERAFLRAVHQGACDHFTTVLGPNADRFHHDHFHVDLARHGRDGKFRVCK